MDRPEQEHAESSRNGEEQAAETVRRGGVTGADDARGARGARGARSGTETKGAKGRCVAEKSVNGMYEWRLKAPNGRVVAVSPAHFRTAAEAVKACADLRDGGAEQLARITHENDGIGWVWSVPGPYGRPLARSPRAYERYATCQNAFRKFMALLVGPAEPTGPVVTAGPQEAEPAHERRLPSLPGPGAQVVVRPRPPDPAGDEGVFREGI